MRGLMAARSLELELVLGPGSGVEPDGRADAIMLGVVATALSGERREASGRRSGGGSEPALRGEGLVVAAGSTGAGCAEARGGGGTAGRESCLGG